MTISSTTRRAGPYAGDGVTVTFPFAFKIFTTADVVVTDLVTATLVETTKVLTTDYAVSMNLDQDASPGGNVVAVAAPAVGHSWTITSNVAATQNVNVTNGGGFFPSVFNVAFDKLTVLVQQLLERANRAITVQVSSSVTNFTIAPLANAVLVWNGAATGLVSTPRSTLAGTLVYDSAAYNAAVAATFAGNNAFGGNNSYSGANTVSGSFDFTAGTLTVATQVPENSSTKAASTAFVHGFLPRGWIDGLTLSAPGSGTSLTVAAGQATDKGVAVLISQAAAIAKTMSAWAVGTGNGGLDQGTIAASTGYHVYKIRRPDTGVDDVLLSQAPDTSATATMTIATPAVVTWALHGFQAGAPVSFATTGALPTGVVAGATYYVKTVVDVNTYQIAATQGGAAINTTGSQSGVHTATSAPAMPANYTQRRYIGGWLTDASVKWQGGYQVGDKVTWNSPLLVVNSIALNTTATGNVQAGAPTGRALRVVFNANFHDTAGSVNDLIVYSTLGSVQSAALGSSLLTSPVSATVNGVGEVVADSGGQIKLVSTASSALYVSVVGFWSGRGRDA